MTSSRNRRHVKKKIRSKRTTWRHNFPGHYFNFGFVCEMSPLSRTIFPMIDCFSTPPGGPPGSFCSLSRWCLSLLLPGWLGRYLYSACRGSRKAPKKQFPDKLISRRQTRTAAVVVWRVCGCRLMEETSLGMTCSNFQQPTSKCHILGARIFLLPSFFFYLGWLVIDISVLQLGINVALWAVSTRRREIILW